MAFVIFKHTQLEGRPCTMLVNGPTGGPLELESQDEATDLAQLLQVNGVIGDAYEVKEIQ